MERRAYERINVQAKGSFVISDDEKFIAEFVAYIDDISESGLKIKVDANEYDHIIDLIDTGSKISFQALESFELYGKEVTKIFNGNVNVVRKENDGDNFYIGCSIKPITEPLQNYIEDRKISIYIKRIHAVT